MTTQIREETARAFAAAMGWRFHPILPIPHTTPIQGFAPNGWILPAPDAPLHEHLAFVGRVAEALGTDTFRNFGGVWKERRAPEWRVAFDHEGRNFGCNGFAPDLSWAAMLAAIEARKGR